MALLRHTGIKEEAFENTNTYCTRTNFRSMQLNFNDVTNPAISQFYF